MGRAEGRQATEMPSGGQAGGRGGGSGKGGGEEKKWKGALGRRGWRGGGGGGSGGRGARPFSFRPRAGSLSSLSLSLRPSPSPSLSLISLFLSVYQVLSAISPSHKSNGWEIRGIPPLSFPSSRVCLLSFLFPPQLVLSFVPFPTRASLSLSLLSISVLQILVHTPSRIFSCSLLSPLSWCVKVHTQVLKRGPTSFTYSRALFIYFFPSPPPRQLNERASLYY